MFTPCANIDVHPDQVVQSLKGSAPDFSSISLLNTAAVLFLIQSSCDTFQTPHLLLTKRSSLVKQAGDLCCPGGHVHQRLDRIFGRLLRLPFSPLKRSRGWRNLPQVEATWTKLLSIFWACCLRESWEELSLQSWRVEFLGALPLDQLRLFRQRILPLVGWMCYRAGFRLNWEVERVVPVSFDSLLEPMNYGVYIFDERGEGFEPWGQGPAAFPCFLHENNQGTEILWGATYRIVMSFLKRLYDFDPPPMEGRRIVKGRLSRNYLTGKTEDE